MFELSLKQVLLHRFRLVLTLVAITLGVTFVTGSLVLTDSSQRLFDEQFDTATRGVDVTVRSSVAFDSAMGVQVDREPVPASVIDRIRTVDGAATIEPVATGRGLIQTEEGAIVPAGSSMLQSWNDGPGNAYRIRDGRRPTADDEAVVDAATARSHGITIGETISVQSTGSRSFTVVGIAGFGDQPGIPDSTVALVTLESAQRLLGLGEKVSEIQVAAADGTTPAELRDTLADTLGNSYAATSSQDTAAAGVAAARDRISYVRLMLLVLAGAALLVGGYLISNTFAIVISQRTRELALLRAAGATGRQVFRMVFGEALLLGVAGSLLGTSLGVLAALGLRDLVGTFGVNVPDGSVTVLPRSLAIGLAVGVLTTVLAALAPSRRAARVAPLEALRSADNTHTSRPARWTVGGIAAAGAITATASALLGAASTVSLAIAALLTVLALTLLGPVITPALARVLGRPLRRLGVPGELAGRLAERAPHRTAATVLALGLSLALMSFMIVLGASVKSSIATGYQEVITADFVVESSRNEMLGGLVPAVRKKVDALPEVAATSRVRFGHWKDQGKVSALTAVDPHTVDQVVSARMLQGSFRALAGGGIVLAEHQAAERGLEVGDALPMTFAKAGDRSLRIVGLLDDGDARALSTEFIIGAGTFDRLFTERVDASIYVALSDEADPETARTSIEKALASFPTAELRDQEAAVKARAGAIDQVLGLVTALLAFTVLIAMLGITNTLALSVVERTREIGLLRSVGMTRSQLRRMVRAEALLVAVLAVTIGLVVGVSLGAAATVALGSAMEATVVVPFDQLAIITALAALAGLLAGVLPARRAARLHLLEAISAG
jgi:putative ABC transport system permease protein